MLVIFFEKKTKYVFFSFFCQTPSKQPWLVWQRRGGVRESMPRCCHFEDVQAVLPLTNDIKEVVRRVLKKEVCAGLPEHEEEILQVVCALKNVKCGDKELIEMAHIFAVCALHILRAERLQVGSSKGLVYKQADDAYRQLQVYCQKCVSSIFLLREAAA